MKSASDMHDAYARFVRSQKPSLLTFSVCTVIVLPLLREGHKRHVLDLFVQRHHHRGCGRRRHPGRLVAVSLALLRRWCHRLSPSSVLPGVDEWRECGSSIGNRFAVSLFRFQKKKKKKEKKASLLSRPPKSRARRRRHSRLLLHHLLLSKRL